MMWDKLNSSRREYYIKASRMAATGVKENLEEDFFSMKRGADKVTPESIGSLGPNEVLVMEGQGESGRLGNRYYIDNSQGDWGLIAGHVNEFIRYAEAHPETKFYVTHFRGGQDMRIEARIAMLFARAYSLPNVALPASFWGVLDYRSKGLKES